MILDLTEEERRYLQELLETDHEATRHELHYTDSRKYKELLKHKLELTEGLTAKVAGVVKIS